MKRLIFVSVAIIMICGLILGCKTPTPSPTPSPAPAPAPAPSPEPAKEHQWKFQGFLPPPEPQHSESWAKLVEMIGMLTEREPKVAMLLFEGHTYVEVANKLGCAEKTIQRTVKKIRKKWEQYIDFQRNQNS